MLPRECERRPQRAPQRPPPPRDALRKGMCRRRLKALLSPPREALTEGVCRHNWLPRESPSEGKCGPHRAPHETPRVGILAAHEGMPPVLRDTAPGLPKQGPPWSIEGEPEGSKNSTLKRPYEADNESDAAGHTGHLESHPCHIKIPSAPQTPKHHVPWGHTHRRNLPSKSPVISILRPIKRAHGWRRRRQRVATSHFNMSRPRHVRHARLHTLHAGHLSCARQINALFFPSLHARCISPQCPDCVRNEGECQTHCVCACAPVFAHARSHLSCPFRSPC
jgi:hypothetical protein